MSEWLSAAGRQERDRQTQKPKMRAEASLAHAGLATTTGFPSCLELGSEQQSLGGAGPDGARTGVQHTDLVSTPRPAWLAAWRGRVLELRMKAGR